MIRLIDVERDKLIGELTEEQLDVLVGELEEESIEDQDYYVSEDTLVLFEEDGVDPALVSLLRKALDGREGMDVRWER